MCKPSWLRLFLFFFVFGGGGGVVEEYSLKACYLFTIKNLLLYAVLIRVQALGKCSMAWILTVRKVLCLLLITLAFFTCK